MSIRELLYKSEEKTTAIGYKLFRRNRKTGKLYPLYVNASEEIPIDSWRAAEMGTLKDNGKVKARGLNEVAVRGGWHINEECPFVNHIYSKVYTEDGLFEDDKGRFDKVHKVPEGNFEYVWYEVEYETTIDCQPLADEMGRNKDGIVIAKNAQLEMVLEHGYYRYKTNPNMFGTWIIAHDMRITRELSRNEVLELCGNYGLSPLPTMDEYNRGKRYSA